MRGLRGRKWEGGLGGCGRRTLAPGGRGGDVLAWVVMSESSCPPETHMWVHPQVHTRCP